MEWIKTSERLPEVVDLESWSPESAPVLVWAKFYYEKESERRVVDCYLRYHKDGSPADWHGAGLSVDGWGDGNAFSCWLEDVTHWMPLPPPPEAE